MDRNQLHEKFKNIVDNVYFNPPENLKVEYPCIVYSVNKYKVKYANDKPYIIQIGYKVTLITRGLEPEKRIAIIEEVPGIHHTSQYMNDNLHHDIYKIE